MALASTSTLPVHLPSTKNPSPSLASHTTLLPTVAESPPQSHRQSTTTIKLPSLLLNLLHLHLSDHPTTADNSLQTPTFLQKAPWWSPTEDISSLRDKIHGPADWSPLLNPLHPWLRREIIKYGEFAQATYDAFDYNPFSQFCGSCLYARHNLFSRLNLSRHGYAPTKYIYAMSHVALPRWLERSIHAESWSHDSNWIGYVAVSDDDEARRMGCRDIVVAWRGTVAQSEWLEDIQGKLEPLGPDPDDTVRVEHGFKSIYTSKREASRYNKSSASEQVMEELKRLVKLYRDKGEEVSITITGHSLGGALALLNAYEAAVEIPGMPVSVISFGAPRVGNEKFAERIEEVGVKALRVAVKQDVVPKMPGLLFNEGLQRRMEGVMGGMEWVYTHVGLELGLDVRESPYLKRAMDLAGFHSLETYLHLVDGYLGKGEGFRRETKRDPALVNKASGLLREDLHIPACWNQEANKGLVCNVYGRWVHPQREFEDIPSPYRDVNVSDFS